MRSQSFLCAASSLSGAARVNAHDGAAGSTALARRHPEPTGKQEIGRSAPPKLVAFRHAETLRNEPWTS